MSDKESTTFHNEDAVFRLAMWSNIVSWLALVLAILQFASGIYELYPQWEQFIMSVPKVIDRVFILVRILFNEPILSGIFAFLVLRGLSQGLYLLMDLYMGEDEEDDDDDDELASD